jgi:glycerophosphoryl diester phosphodiesterase
MICFAHRGASGHAPENTLQAFHSALSLGATWIELDVFRVEDELLVLHDSRVERTTNGQGNLRRLDLAYLRSLDAGKGEKIPFLREVFEAVSGLAGINIELKGENTAGAVDALIKTCIEQGPYQPDQFLVSSFNHQELMKFARLAPDIRTGAIIAALPLHNARFAEELGVYSIHIQRDCITREFVTDAHRRGFNVFVYTINHEDDLAEMASIGVDGFFTNFPELGKNSASSLPNDRKKEGGALP